jgi:hypothetical protein
VLCVTPMQNRSILVITVVLLSSLSAHNTPFASASMSQYVTRPRRTRLQNHYRNPNVRAWERAHLKSAARET